MGPCEKCQDTGRVQGFVARIANMPPDEDCECRPKPAAKGETVVGDVFDGLVIRSLNEKQMIDRVVTDFIGPSDDADSYRKSIPSRERVERYVGRLVEAFGAKLGGLSRTQLVSKVMKRFEARSRKRAAAYWAKYPRQV